MHNSVSQKFRIFKSRNHTEHSSLLGESKVGLKTNEIIHCSLFVFLAELNHRKGFPARSRVNKPYGLKRSVAKRIVAALRHNLNGHTALKYLELFLLLLAVKFLNFRLFCTDKLVIKCVVLLARHGAVDIVRVALIIS